MLNPSFAREQLNETLDALRMAPVSSFAILLGKILANFIFMSRNSSPTIRAYNNLGVVLLNMDRHQEAFDSLQKAVTIKPDYAEAWSNLGDALRNLGRSAEPIVAIRRALSLKPDAAGPANNLGLVLDSGPA